MADEKNAAKTEVAPVAATPQQAASVPDIKVDKAPRHKTDDRLTSEYRKDAQGRTIGKRSNGTYEIRSAKGDLEWVGPIDAIPGGFVPAELEKARDVTDPLIFDHPAFDAKKEVDILAHMQGETDTRAKAEKVARNEESPRVQTAPVK